MHKDTIFLSVYAEYYEHWTMFDKTAARKILRVFLRHTVY